LIGDYAVSAPVLKEVKYLQYLGNHGLWGGIHRQWSALLFLKSVKLSKSN
jgi:hypothetical protein